MLEPRHGSYLSCPPHFLRGSLAKPELSARLAGWLAGWRAPRVCLSLSQALGIQACGATSGFFVDAWDLNTGSLLPQQALLSLGHRYRAKYGARSMPLGTCPLEPHLTVEGTCQGLHTGEALTFLCCLLWHIWNLSPMKPFEKTEVPFQLIPVQGNCCWNRK